MLKIAAFIGADADLVHTRSDLLERLEVRWHETVLDQAEVVTCLPACLAREAAQIAVRGSDPLYGLLVGHAIRYSDMNPLSTRANLHWSFAALRPRRMPAQVPPYAAFASIATSISRHLPWWKRSMLRAQRVM
jgi:hypothetical protein